MHLTFVHTSQKCFGTPWSSISSGSAHNTHVVVEETERTSAYYLRSVLLLEFGVL